MKHSEFEALMDLIDAKIADKISDAFGRDGLRESMRVYELTEAFKLNFVVSD